MNVEIFLLIHSYMRIVLYCIAIKAEDDIDTMRMNIIGLCFEGKNEQTRLIFL